MNGGWPTVKLGTVLTDIQPGFASGRHNSAGEGIPHFRPMNVSTEGRIDRSVMKYVDPAAGRPDIRLAPGDVLFNNTNSPELVGKTAIFENGDSPAFSNHMTRLRFDATQIDGRYAALCLHQAWRQGWFAAHCNNHVSQASIGREVLKSFELELPSLDIQRAIASLSATVEGSRLSASAHLSSGAKAIDRLRRAILVAACTGRLSKDQGHGHDVPSEIEEILATYWSGRKPRRQKEQPVGLALPDLPARFSVRPLGECAAVIEYGTSQRCDSDPEVGIPVLRMGNIQSGHLDFGNLKYCAADRELEGLLLHDGDILFNRTNSPELVGKSAVFHAAARMSFASYLIRVRLLDGVAHPDYVNYWLNSAWGRAWARLAKTDGVSQSNINGSKLALMPIPLPSFEEQARIVVRVSALLELAEQIGTKIEKADRAIERSAQSVLAKAFRGDLVEAAS